LGHSANTTSRGVDGPVARLAATGRGLIAHRPDPNDRRGKQIALTDTGKRVIDKTVGRSVAMEVRLLSVLTPRRAGKAQRAAQEADCRDLGSWLRPRVLP
jgi:DNA-binding MarR family transcriptional regulator